MRSRIDSSEVASVGRGRAGCVPLRVEREHHRATEPSFTGETSLLFHAWERAPTPSRRFCESSFKRNRQHFGRVMFDAINHPRSRRNLRSFVQGLQRHTEDDVSQGTERFPEAPATVEPRYRGIHVLQRDENGLEKCVGCFLCSAACPANCIYIEAAENTETNRISAADRYAQGQRGNSPTVTRVAC